MISTRVHSHQALTLVHRLQRLLAERQQLLMEGESYYTFSRDQREARLAQLRAETSEVLDSLAELIPPEFPGRISRTASVA